MMISGTSAEPSGSDITGDANDRAQTLRVATWNVAHRGVSVAARLGALARQARVDLLLLQEANYSSLASLTEAAGLDWAVTALDAGAPMPANSGRDRITAILGLGARPADIGYLPALQFPGKMVYAQLHPDFGDITVASYHAMPGVTHGRLKVDHALALLDWVNLTPGTLVVGADANTPKIDHPSRDKVRTHWHTGLRVLQGGTGDDAMFGAHPAHRLDDALRCWLDEHPDEFARIAENSPDGPLAVSHYTGKRRTFAGYPRRFDALWISPDLAVENITYDYHGAVTAGSDHALVTAELRTAT